MKRFTKHVQCPQQEFTFCVPIQVDISLLSGKRQRLQATCGMPSNNGSGSKTVALLCGAMTLGV